ncbi:unnamed protein product [Phytophthora fragariaefolia]|uniref:Unnamed protein product n=1 Tax=Phytophthora fragariaefolia TaxID=1490495 RepID=A0A9W6XB80_9STRA|nr:unnamed protein product [Phytophthora fragariaefolia]
MCSPATVVAYASKLLTGSQKNWINKQDGISEIGCWGVVWSTCKYRCYLDKRQFDLYTYHQALTWIFSPGNRTSNAKLARWAMELSSLGFKVHHKPGKSMGHVDGLPRLPMVNVRAIRMSDLFNPVERDQGSSADPGGVPLDAGDLLGDSDGFGATEQESEPGERSGTDYRTVESSEGRTPANADPPDGADDSVGEPGDYDGYFTEEDEPAGLPVSNVDLFGLGPDQFVAEQRNVSWIVALTAFSKDGALPLDPNLRSRVVKMAPKFVIAENILRRRVNLPARVGPARSETVPSFYQTLGIKKLFGAPYHPQTQGLVERFNGTLIGMFKIHVSEAQDDWDVYLPRVLFPYRTAYHEALGDSPFFSLYGRDPVLPLDVAFLNLGTQWKSNEVAQYLRRLYKSLRDSRHLVERQLLKAQDRGTNGALKAR